MGSRLVEISRDEFRNYFKEYITRYIITYLGYFSLIQGETATIGFVLKLMIIQPDLAISIIARLRASFISISYDIGLDHRQTAHSRRN